MFFTIPALTAWPVSGMLTSALCSSYWQFSSLLANSLYNFTQSKISAPSCGFRAPALENSRTYLTEQKTCDVRESYEYTPAGKISTVLTTVIHISKKNPVWHAGCMPRTSGKRANYKGFILLLVIKPKSIIFSNWGSSRESKCGWRFNSLLTYMKMELTKF